MILDSITPPDLLFPSRFSSYRRAQIELAEFALYGPGGGDLSNEFLLPRRFTCGGAPPGVGKSLTAHTIGRLSGMKYVILTATKALEDQQCEDFVDGTDTVNIRGRANYRCVGLSPGFGRRVDCNCDEGAGDYDCSLSGKPGCTYFERVQDAKKARGIVTNYAYWIAARMQNPRALETSGERIGLLIADEAHLCMSALANALSVWVSNEDLHRWASQTRALVNYSAGKEWGRVSMPWLSALDDVITGAQVKLATIEQQSGKEEAWRTEDHRRLTRLIQGVSRVVLHGGDNNWLWRQTRNGISFDCVWPGKYAEQYLWSGADRVVLLSATLVPKAMQLLRIPATEYHFREWPRQFSKANSPVWWIPTGRLRHGSSEAELNKCVEVGDKIFAEWGAYKGLTHSQSYTRAQWLQSRCSWGRHMHINERGDATGTLERFLRADPPAVLVSPSYTTGTDLANDACRWIWIPKLPFPDRSDPLMVARMQDDEDYYNYETMQTLVQACGRGTRSESDWSTTLITDDNVGNFRNYARRFAPRWFEVSKWEKERVPAPCR